MKRNDNFYFLSLSLFQPILAWNAIEMFFFFLIFWKILLFFWNFLVRVGMERNRTIISIFSISRPFPTYCLIFWFFCYFSWIFSNASGRNETKQYFLFSLSEHFPTNFGLKSRNKGSFYFSEFLCYFFGIFYYASGWYGTER